jgi:hypothetical protein
MLLSILHSCVIRRARTAPWLCKQSWSEFTYLHGVLAETGALTIWSRKRSTSNRLAVEELAKRRKYVAPVVPPAAQLSEADVDGVFVKGGALLWRGILSAS